MTALAVLLALAAAGGAAAAGYLIAAWGARRSSIGSRYTIWSSGFWCGPVVAIATIVVIAANAGAIGDSPPVALKRLAGATNHVLVGSVVAMALLAVAVVAMLRIARLGIATARVHVMIRRAGARYPAQSPYCARPPVPVLLSDDVCVPVLAGILRPVVLLPADASARFTGRQIALICEHEFTHARRGDNARLWLEEAAAAFLWWSPATMLARRHLAAMREASCDAIVLQRSDTAERTAYADALLQVLGHRPRLVSAYSSGGAAEAAQRIRLLLAPDGQPGSRIPLLLAIAALLLTVAVWPILAARAIDQTGASFALSSPIDISFRRTGARDARTGRPLYTITYGRPTGAAERLLAPSFPSETAMVALNRRGGGWRLTTIR